MFESFFFKPLLSLDILGDCPRRPDEVGGDGGTASFGGFKLERTLQLPSSTTSGVCLFIQRCADYPSRLSSRMSTRLSTARNFSPCCFFPGGGQEAAVPDGGHHHADLPVPGLPGDGGRALLHHGRRPGEHARDHGEEQGGRW